MRSTYTQMEVLYGDTFLLVQAKRTLPISHVLRTHVPHSLLMYIFGTGLK